MKRSRRRTSISRRTFLAAAGSGGLAAIGLARGAPVSAEDPPAAARALAAARAAFLDPPLSARPLTRWWWFGGAVTPAEITRELTFMKEAGLGGAEIQPVYPVAVDDPARGIRNLSYHAEEFRGALRHAVREAHRLGLQLDFTLGSGWPYGGPFVPTSLAARRLRLLSRDVTGPRAVDWDLTPLITGDDRVVAVVAAPVLDGGETDLDRSRVVPGQPRTEGGTGTVRRGTAVRELPVSEGRWRIMVFLDSPTGQQVKRPTLGMEGSVLDHHSREAMQLFLRAAGDRVLDGLAAAADPPFHSVFCDSLEVYGADWTADLLAEFKGRRGYDLAPHLPALWEEAGPLTPHVRHDFHLTLSELTLERFFAPLAAWAEKRGMTARVQAHGAMGDVMQAYGLAHVPEGETIFLGDRYQVNLRHRRLASSAAHLYGRPLVSAESYTWLRMPMFVTTLEAMKAATDAVFLDGMNHVVNHGYAYSPPEAGEPGWSFYASTEVNHTNTWWRHYPHLARYVQRVSAVLRQGVAVNRLAVYLPLADLYAGAGAGSLHVDVEAEWRLGAELFDGLRRAGYDFDLVHDHALAALATVEGGELRAGTGRYPVVVVPGARFMPTASAARLAELVRGGGHVVFLERLPEGAPGLREREDPTTRRTLEGLFGPGGPGAGRPAAAGRGTVTLVADRASLRERLSSVLPPDFAIVEAAGEVAREGAAENVGFVHRQVEGADLFFVANVSGEPRDLRTRFAVGHRAPERWDAETGAADALVAFEYVSAGGTKATDVELRLAPFESCFVAFGTSREAPVVTRTRWREGALLSRKGGTLEASGLVEPGAEPILTLGSGRTRRVAVAAPPGPVAVEGPWTLRLGAGPAFDLPRLVSWTERPEGRAFSGWGTYEAQFDLPASGDDVEWMVDLGAVHETAQVSLNGRDLGAAWKGRRRLACGDAARPGANRLKVEVANLWIHHVVAQPPADWRALEETYGIRWGRYGEVKPETLPPSGLLGPVRLVAFARARVRL